MTWAEDFWMEFGAPHYALCPNCADSFPSDKPLPSCNECEACFCSEQCLEGYHMKLGHIHNYRKPLEE